MVNKQMMRAVGLIIFLLLALLWTCLLSVQVRRELKEVKKLRDSANLTLHIFNVRKSDLHVQLWENRRDIFINRNEIKKARALMIGPEYHITMVPILVSGKAAIPKGVIKAMKTAN